MTAKESIAFQNSRVLVLGGTGFIGLQIVKKLVSLGANVYIFIRSETNIDKLAGVESEVNFLYVDILDAENICESIKSANPEYIFNFSQPSSQGLKVNNGFVKQLQSTSFLLHNVLQSIVQNKILVKGFVHACSSTIYEWNKDTSVLSECTPLAPSTFRGLIKLNERNICMYYASRYRVPIRLARIFRAYGPGDQEYKFIIKTLMASHSGKSISVGSSEFKRDYVYIDDLVRGCIKLAETDLEPGTEVNLASGEDYSPKEILEMIESILGREIKKTYDFEPNEYDRGEFKADISLAMKLLNWKPAIDIRQGLSETIQWYMKLHQSF